MRKAPNPAVKLGRSDYHNSKEREDNPYAHGTANQKAWDKGWMKERRESAR